MSIARRVLDLCRLRGGPADMPYAPLLLAALIVASVVLDVLVGGVLQDGGDAFARSLLSSAVVLGLCWAALGMRRLAGRFTQTATALVACSLLFSLLQMPLAWLGGPPPATAAELSGAQVMIGWATLALFAWQVSVDAHIMRRAMDISFGFGFALVVSWVMAYWALDSLIFGTTT
jgi:hypothetical protein